MSHVLLSPVTNDHWSAYHHIRRTVLFERRGRFGVYDPDHKDETLPNHFPKLLLFDETPIGVVRIDIDGEVARFRRVAITEACQAQGHGRMLLELAEAFALERGALRAEVSVAADAVGFYLRSGYDIPAWPEKAGSVPMTKALPST
jgi:GNAT superfamily N-acetyltransferase